jgi:hypothetical protein
MFDKDGFHEYCKINPSESPVMININRNNVVGDLPMLLPYICRLNYIEKLYPSDSTNKDGVKKR